MADENSDGTIRPEQFERVQRENKELKATIEELTGTVKDTAFLTSAYEHFKGKEGISDPYALALQAVQNVTLKGVEADELSGKLDSWHDSLRSMFGSPSSSPPEPDAPPVADTTPVPGFARPNPAADGAPPGNASQMIDTRSQEFQRLVEANNIAEIERLDKEGLIAWKDPSAQIGS